MRWDLSDFLFYASKRNYQTVNQYWKEDSITEEWRRWKILDDWPEPLDSSQWI